MKKRVLQINKLYVALGGIENVVRDIAEGLNDKTLMTVLACKQRGRTRITKTNDIKIYESGSIAVLNSLPISFSFFYYFRKLIKEQDVIHIHEPFPLADIAVMIFNFTGKLIVSWHSDIVRQKIGKFILKPFVINLLERADVIIVAAQGVINGSEYLTKYRKKCIIIPFGVKLDTFFTYHSPVNSLKQMSVTILFIGRLVYYKGCEVLLQAFAQTVNTRLILIGNGILEMKLKNMAAELNVVGRIEFLGEVSEEEKHNQLQSCDIFVLPSIEKSEAFGIVQIEAMAYGKPVVNTNLPSGVPDVSIHNETGLTVEPNNPKALAEAITWLVQHDDERYRMGINARKRVEKYFTYEREMDEIFRVYESV